MLDSAQAISAAYRYDPYGNQISATGTMSAANVYRFSSKERIYDGTTVSGYYYFGYRFYDPNPQRSLNTRRLLPCGLAASDLIGLGPKACKVPGLPVLVIGGRKDNAVRAADVEHVAKFHGTSVHWCDLPHDLLLVPGWEEVAITIEDWALAIGQKSLPQPVS
jgi:hypothetical protein